MQVYPVLINRVADLICRKKCKTIPIITVKEPAQYSTIPVLFARGAGSYVFSFRPASYYILPSNYSIYIPELKFRIQ